MKQDSRILVTGGSGLLGTCLARRLREQGYASVTALSSRDVDLSSFDPTVRAFTERYRPEYVFHLAGTVNGLGGNLKDPCRIFLGNVLINTHVVEASRRAGVKKIVAMGSICAYPSPPKTPGPLREEELFFGEPGPGERAYGQAKRAMLTQLETCQQTAGMDYAFAISTNLYGPDDRFNLENGHVVPSLIKKFYEASRNGHPVQIWGDGLSRRDFMYSFDAADALIAIMLRLTGRVNLATGRMTTIRELAAILGKVSGVGDRIVFDPSRPKGHDFESISVERLRSIGWEPRTPLETGIPETYRWYAARDGKTRT